MDKNNKKESKNKLYYLITSLIIAAFACFLIIIPKFIDSGFKDVYNNKIEKLKQYETELPNDYIYSGKYKNHKKNESAVSFMNIEMDIDKKFQIRETSKKVLTNSDIYIFKEGSYYFACFKNNIKTKCYFAFNYK